MICWLNHCITRLPSDPNNRNLNFTELFMVLGDKNEIVLIKQWNQKQNPITNDINS